MIKKSIILVSIPFLVYGSCNLENKKSNELCLNLIDKNIPEKYIYDFLNSEDYLSIDKKTLKTIHPKKIKYHRQQERKANNNLVKYIPKIVNNLEKYKKIYDIAERKFKVNREVVAGVLMKETRLGGYEPKHNATTTLSTIYNNIEPNTKRNKWLHKLAKTNLLSLINYCYQNGLNPNQCTFKSSYIGAIGFPQFMPNSFKYIVPYKGKYSLLDNMEDSILSVANYLNKRGKYKKLFDFSKIKNFKKIENDWYEFEFSNKHASFSYEGKYNCFSCENKNLEEVRKYIKDIMRYNNSSNYAVGVFRLAWSSNLKSKNINKTERFIKYTVKKGDSLSKIGKEYSLNYHHIKELNNLSSDKIYINQTLILPKKI